VVRRQDRPNKRNNAPGGDVTHSVPFIYVSLFPVSSSLGAEYRATAAPVGPLVYYGTAGLCPIGATIL
jgi:hypothetical protein